MASSNKKLKKLARARQRETGERYTVALENVRRQNGVDMHSNDSEGARKLKSFVDTVLQSESPTCSVSDPRAILPVSFVLNEGDSPVVKLDGDILRVTSSPIPWARVEVLGITVQSFNGSWWDGGVLVRNLCPSNTSNGDKIDLLPPESNPEIEDGWHDARRFSVDADVRWQLTTKTILDPDETMSIEVKGGDDAAYAAIALIVAVIESFPEAVPMPPPPEELLMDGSEVLKEKHLARRHPRGHLSMDPMRTELGQILYDVKGGRAAVGAFETLAWSPLRPCVLHGVNVQAHDPPTGVVVVIKDLKVIRAGASRTPDLLFTDLEVGSDHASVTPISNLRGNPILLPGDTVQMKIGAFAPSGEAAQGTVSVVTHKGFSQQEISDLLDLLP